MRNNKTNWSLGQAITVPDLHAVEDMTRAFLGDALGGGFARTRLTDAGAPTGYCFVPQAAQAYPKPTTTRTITNVAGWVLQMVSAPDGVTPKFLAYYLADDDLQTTLAIGDGSNPRIDGIFIKIEDNDTNTSETRDFQDMSTGALSSQTTLVRRSTKITSQVVTGTPGSNPALPATPAGFVPYAYVYVPTAYNSTFTTAHLSDWRIPMRLSAVDVFSGEALLVGTSTLDSARHMVTTVDDNPNDSGGMYRFPFGPDCRILAVEIFGIITDNGVDSTTQVKLARVQLDVDPFTYALQGNSTFLPTMSPLDFIAHSAAETIHKLSAGTLGLKHAVWGNGRSAGMAEYALNSTASGVGSKLGVLTGIDVGGGGCFFKIGYVRFIYAY